MRRPKIFMVAALVASTVAVGLGGSTALACSLAAPTLVAPESVPAGGTLSVSGANMAEVVGDVGVDCGGDWEWVALDEVIVTVTFETNSGPKVAKVTAGVDAAEPAWDSTIGPIEFDVPIDATKATITTSANTGSAVVIVTGAPTTTTVPKTPAPPVASPMPADPRYTG